MFSFITRVRPKTFTEFRMYCLNFEKVAAGAELGLYVNMQNLAAVGAGSE